MRYFGTRTAARLTAGFIITGLAALGMLAGTVAFPDVPASSESFDCDDGALAMYDHFLKAGISARPVIGNLEMDDEAYQDSNHVWLLVSFGGREIAYDWGLPRLDRQHYEGYEISLAELQAAVAADMSGGTSLAAASP